jgi:hypothetical protein
MASTNEKEVVQQAVITPGEARAIAKEAYVYGFPLVDNYRVQHAYFVDKSNPEYKSTWNTITNMARVYTPEDKAVQSPNSDTPYSFIGADLRTEPLVLTMPEVEKDRYYSVQFIDMFTFNFAYAGSRATGNAAGSYLLAGPYWMGEKPGGIKEVMKCETDFAFALYRTQLFNPGDIENVKKVQAGYKVQPLSAFLGKPAPPAAPPVDFIKPLTPEQQRTSPEFFNILSFILQFCPMHPSEMSMMQRFAKLGIRPGRKFDAQQLSPELQKAVEDGIADAWNIYAEVKKLVNEGKISAADIFGSRDYLTNNFPYRMTAAKDGIYGNSKEEALYPAYFIDSGKQPLNGTGNNYTLRFAPGQLPPVKAFWSLTLYELPASLLYANPLNRYLINSPMLPDLKKDADGGLTIYIQHESPGKEKESNWLPAPAGQFLCALRLYWPEKAALDGTWKAPALNNNSMKTATSQPVPVTAENFNRAESDLYFTSIVKKGGFGKFFHHREPTAVDEQDVIRMNRDTLYSSVVFDLDAGPVTITLPDAGKRFMSMQVFDEDEYSPMVVYKPGTYALKREDIGTRYCVAALRTLVNPADLNDIQQVHALQDAVKVEQADPGKFEVPDWDQQSQQKIREALLVLGATLPDSKRMFGTKDTVDPVRFLIGSAMAWGGNPEKEATYLNVTPPRNDGKTVHKLTVKDVPVDGFWSVTVYNAKGYFEPNDRNAYSINNITAKKDADGSITIQFGGCDDKSVNCLPIMPGWNYIVRMYRPRPEILNGTWNFPEATPVK